MFKDSINDSISELKLVSRKVGYIMALQDISDHGIIDPEFDVPGFIEHLLQLAQEGKLDLSDGRVRLNG